MSNALANLEGLENLLASGYSLTVIGAHLVVNDVWYVNPDGQLSKGRLAAPLTMTTPSKIGTPSNHQMLWDGQPPCHSDRTTIPFAAQSTNTSIGGVTYASHLSNKPIEYQITGFPDYTELVKHYVALISGPAMQIASVSPLTHAEYDVPQNISPFKVADTFSARAQINDLNRLLADDRIAVIGLGGTGAFVLDFLVKTPVHSIDAYDFDVFEVHNGFRSPGEVPFSYFGQTKTAFYRKKYESFRHRLSFHNRRVAVGDDALFADITFVFVCIDDGEARKEICNMLMALRIPFIDVGMGVEKENGRLDGLIRTTLFTDITGERAKAEVPFDKRNEAGAYRVFVQIAELNALNAALAVVKYKQFRGFYTDDAGSYHSLLSIGSSDWMGVT